MFVQLCTLAKYSQYFRILRAKLFAMQLYNHFSASFNMLYALLCTSNIMLVMARPVFWYVGLTQISDFSLISLTAISITLRLKSAKSLYFFSQSKQTLNSVTENSNSDFVFLLSPSLHFSSSYNRIA